MHTILSARWVPVLYLPVFLLPRVSLTFRAARLPSCLQWGSCCGRWRNRYPPCMILPDRTAPADQKWHLQLFQPYPPSQVQVCKTHSHLSIRLHSDYHHITRKMEKDVKVNTNRGLTSQDPSQEELHSHQHFLCPTLLHFQCTLDARWHPSLPPKAMLVYSVRLHECG